MGREGAFLGGGRALLLVALAGVAAVCGVEVYDNSMTEDLAPALASLAETHGLTAHAEKLRLVLLEKQSSGGAATPALHGLFDQIFDDLVAKLKRQKAEALETFNAKKANITARLHKVMTSHPADYVLRSDKKDLVRRALDAQDAEAKASAEDHMKLEEYREKAVKDVNFAKGEAAVALQWNRTYAERIQKRAQMRHQQINRLYNMKMLALDQEDGVVDFVHYIVTGTSKAAADKIGLPPTMKRGMYCDLTPYVNNSFESNAQARNGALLKFGQPLGKACINWKTVGGVDSSCCMVPSASARASHAPWCWTSPTEYTYCWRSDLPPESYGWKTEGVMPLRDHFSPKFANSSINDCGGDCVTDVPDASTEDQCLQACQEEDTCVGATLVPSGVCRLASSFGTCDERDQGGFAKNVIRCRTGDTCDFVCSSSDRIVSNRNHRAWLKLPVTVPEPETGVTRPPAVNFESSGLGGGPGSASAGTAFRH